MKRISIPATLIVTAALFLAAPAQAAEFCATTSEELQDALTEAADNDEHDTIRIAAGHYPTPEQDSFLYDAWGGDDFDLTLTGGWTESSGNPCGQHTARHPSATLLDGRDAQRVMTLNIRRNSNVTVRGLAFMNGYVPDTGGAGGLRICVWQSGYTANILVERNLFMNNEAYRSGGLRICGFSNLQTISLTAVGNARIGMVNNTFVGNHARFVHAAARITVNSGEAGALGAGIYVTNNTVLDNTWESDVSTSRGAFALVGTIPNIYVINNNMWGNDGADLRVGNSSFSDGEYYLHNNNIGVSAGPRPVTSQSDNISITPEYENCAPCFDWIPVSGSPLVDAGTHPPVTEPFWHLPVIDGSGNSRISGDSVDIGAYENHDRLFTDRFESSN